jgi:hypothetical protein
MALISGPSGSDTTQHLFGVMAWLRRPPASTRGPVLPDSEASSYPGSGHFGRRGAARANHGCPVAQVASLHEGCAGRVTANPSSRPRIFIISRNRAAQTALAITHPRWNSGAPWEELGSADDRKQCLAVAGVSGGWRVAQRRGEAGFANLGKPKQTPRGHCCHA